MYYHKAPADGKKDGWLNVVSDTIVKVKGNGNMAGSPVAWIENE